MTETQTRIDRKDNITERTYICTIHKNRDGSYGTAIIFPKPHTEKPFAQQTPEKVMTLEEYRKSTK